MVDPIGDDEIGTDFPLLFISATTRSQNVLYDSVRNAFAYSSRRSNSDSDSDWFDFSIGFLPEIKYIYNQSVHKSKSYIIHGK